MSRNTLIGLALVAGATVAWFVTRTEDAATPDAVPVANDDVGAVREPVVLQGADANKAPVEGGQSEQTPGAAGVLPRPGKTVEVTGLVADQLGAPQGGVRVNVEYLDRAGIGATTDAQGRFTLDVAQSQTMDAALVARKGDLVATRRLYVILKKRAVDVGTMVLAQGHYIDVVVRSARDGVPPASLLAQLDGPMGGTVARTATDADGRARIGPMSEGDCRIFAYAPGCGRGLAMVSLPQDDIAPVEIEIEAARDVSVTVVDAGTGAPVAGADLILSEDLTYPGGARSQAYVPTRVIDPTGIDGKTIIRDLSMSVRLTVAVHVAGRPPVTPSSSGLQMPRIGPNSTEVRIELPALRTIRWLITDKDGPPPGDGTALVLRNGPQSHWVGLPASGRIENGHIVVEGLLPTYIHALAVTPDGRIARLFAKNEGDLGNETSFRSPRSIDVSVTRPDGEPVAGMWVGLRGPGNNQVGDVLQLDASGRATFRDLYGMKVTVYLRSSESSYGGTAIGTVDLDEGSGNVNATVARKREVLLEITLDGTLGVPEGLMARTWSGMSGMSHPIKVLDRARGTAQLTWQPATPGARATIGVSAPDWILEGSGLQVEDAGSGPIDRKLTFVGGGVLDAHLLMPSRQVSVVLQRWNEREGTWIDAHGTQIKPTATGRAKVGPLPAGRHRLASSVGGGVSASFDVVKGETATVTFDLRKEGLATGRVEVPDDMDASDVRIHVDGKSYVRPHSAGQAVSKDGSFRIWLTGSDDVVLRAQHPLLVPASDGGTRKLREPRDGILLKLVPGPRITATLDTTTVLATGPRARSSRLLAFKGPASRDATSRTCPIEIKDGLLTCGSLPAGTWTLWLDVDNFVPLTIENVVVPPSGIDLGTLSMTRGSSFRVTYLVNEGQAPPRGSVWLRALSGPSYLRGTSGSEAVAGLGAGRYTLQIASYGGVGPRIDEEIEVDGASAVERIVDLR